MPKQHRITGGNGQRADVGDTRFIMQPPTITGLDSWVNLPCWLCREPIKQGEAYYVAAVSGRVMSDPAIVHATHVD